MQGGKAGTQTVWIRASVSEIS
jgi:2-keto-3-deoxy-galactonokinase